MYIFKLFIGHMRVNLGRGDVLMAQELLHQAQINALGQKIGGKRVP
jgi:hypothetical protein